MSGKRLFFMSLGLKFTLGIICLVLIAAHYFSYHIIVSMTNPALNIDIGDVYDVNGLTPIIKAANDGDIDLVRNLINAGAPLDSQARNPDMRTNLPSGNTALHFAIYSSNYDSNYVIAFMLIDAGANVRIPNQAGDTPLHYTEQIVDTDKRKPLVGALVKQGANVNAQNNEGQTITHLAVYDNNRDWIDVLKTDFGSLVNFNLGNKKGLTPLQNANLLGFTFLADHFNQKTIVIGSDGNIVARDPVMQMTGMMLAGIASNTNLATQLIAQGANLNAWIPDELRNGVLQLMLLHQNVPMLKFFLDAGANSNMKNELGDTPLHYVLKIDSIGKDNAQMVDLRNQAALYLLQKKANINAQNNQGNTVLHVVVLADAIDLMKFFVKNAGTKINLSLQNNKNKTAMMLARDLGRTDIIQQLQILENVNSMIIPAIK